MRISSQFSNRGIEESAYELKTFIGDSQETKYANNHRFSSVKEAHFLLAYRVKQGLKS